MPTTLAQDIDALLGTSATQTTHAAHKVVLDRINTDKANLASPTFTGTPLITTTPTLGDDSHKIADTAFVVNAIANKLDKSTEIELDNTSDFNELYALSESNYVVNITTQPANYPAVLLEASVFVARQYNCVRVGNSTAKSILMFSLEEAWLVGQGSSEMRFASLSDVVAYSAYKAPIASPTFTGTPLITTTPTQGDNSHKIADTAYVDAAVSAGGGGGATLPYIEYTARLYQNYIDNPIVEFTFIDELTVDKLIPSSSNYRNVIYTRLGAGWHAIDIKWKPGGTSQISNYEKLAISFSDSKFYVTGRSSGSGGGLTYIRFEIQSVSGVDDFAWTNITLKLYN